MSEIAKNSVLIQVQISTWSGRGKNTLDDFSSSTAQELNKPTLTIGTKALTDPKLLNPFVALRQRVSRSLRDVAVPFMGGYVCTADRKDSILEVLDEHNKDFNSYVADFFNDYPTVTENFINGLDPQLQVAVRKALPDVKSLYRRFSFSVGVWTISEKEIGRSGMQDLQNTVRDTVEQALDDAIAVLQTRKNSRFHATIRDLRQLIGGVSGFDQQYPSIEQQLADLESLPEDKRSLRTAQSVLNSIKTSPTFTPTASDGEDIASSLDDIDVEDESADSQTAQDTSASADSGGDFVDDF